MSLEAIAREVGVSARTVSNVLSGRNKENWESTARRAEQIRAVAARLGYQPNGAATAVRTGKFGCVAILLSEEQERSSLFRGLLDGICEALDAQDMHLTVARYADEVLSREEFVPKFLRQKMCDGVLINYNVEIPPRLIEQTRRALPVVWLNSQQEGDCVRPDDFGAGHSATQAMLERGHRRVAFTAHHSTHYSVAARRAGYETAMRYAGLAPQIMRAPRTDESWLDVARETLSAPQAPTAFVNYSAATTQPLLCAAAQLGRHVPGQLSLITFDDEPFYDFVTGAHVSTWRVPEAALGRAAVAMLLGKIADPTRVFAPQTVKFEIVPGSTLGPCCE